ncbi:MAG: hypothetical protein JW700_00695 [Candidatus Aenigmarchaeota archaeon]|nr:hypothetical protein [Candidatus Aenigmarchaeota archaeon]
MEEEQSSIDPRVTYEDLILNNVFLYYSEEDDSMLLTKMAEPKELSDPARYGKDFVMNRKKLEKLREAFNGKALIYDSDDCLGNCYTGNFKRRPSILMIDRDLPLKFLVDNGYILPMDTCCSEMQ